MKMRILFLLTLVILSNTIAKLPAADVSEPFCILEESEILTSVTARLLTESTYHIDPCTLETLTIIDNDTLAESINSMLKSAANDKSISEEKLTTLIKNMLKYFSAIPGIIEQKDTIQKAFSDCSFSKLFSRFWQQLIEVQESSFVSNSEKYKTISEHARLIVKLFCTPSPTAKKAEPLMLPGDMTLVLPPAECSIKRPGTVSAFSRRSAL